MSTQDIAVVVLFVLALAYVGRLLYRNFRARNNCGGSCKCGVDFSNGVPKKD
ncbi:MAG: FeoB-associated Cys-rich membrane protein [Sphingobacteriaceae bacterium]